MARKKPTSLAFRLRKTKAALLAVALTLAGIVLMVANSWLADLELGSWAWLHALPIGELGGTLFGAGFLGALFEYSFRKDQEEATAERFRDIINVPRQVVGRISSVSKLGMAGSARPRCTSSGRFQEIAS